MAKLATKSEEKWIYVHRATKTVINTPPRSLPEAVIKEFDVAASHGMVPQYCQGHLEDGRIFYKINNPSTIFPRSWRTLRHPGIIEADGKAYLAAYDSHASKPAKATLLTASGQTLPINLRLANLNGMSGTLLIEDVDKDMIGNLCWAFQRIPVIPFFIFCHLVYKRLHDIQDLEEELMARYWMSHRGTSDEVCWVGAHYDVFHDYDRGKVHFGVSQLLNSSHAPPEPLDVIRVSMFSISTRLST
jgi:hypothetical protein